MQQGGSEKMQSVPADETSDLAIRAAWLSFVGGRTQHEIAARLGVSSTKVHRLIAYAQQKGLVRFQVEGRPSDCLILEESILTHFGLTNCIVAPDLGTEDEASAIETVATSAGPILTNLLSGTDFAQVGVGMGRTLSAAIAHMPQIARSDLRIVSICGSLTRRLSANPYDVVQHLAGRTGGDGYFLPVPYIAEGRAERDMFLTQKSVQELLALARRSELFVVGIGSLATTGHLVAMNMISALQQRELVAAGAVGDLMGRFVDIDGRLVPSEMSERVVGLNLEDARGRRVVALAGGVSKVAAVVGSLRSGIVTDLIVDEALARGVVAMVGIEDGQLPQAMQVEEACPV